MLNAMLPKGFEDSGDKTCDAPPFAIFTSTTIHRADYGHVVLALKAQQAANHRV